MKKADQPVDGVVTETARAKINLTLHVTGRRADGYHELDSLVVFADLGDQISLRRAENLRLTVTGPFSAGVPTDQTNLVLQAAKAAGIVGADITLEKNLPAAAGIGGGSSDAAALLRAAEKSHGVDLPSHDRILALGADVPMCVLARAAQIGGIGGQIDPVQGLPPLPAVLVNPGVAVHTAEVFYRLEGSFGHPMSPSPDTCDRGDFMVWLRNQRNDLQPPAMTLAPVIGEVLGALNAQHPECARMSGSGATCFGLFKTTRLAEDAAAAISKVHPDWWVRATVLR